MNYCKYNNSIKEVPAMTNIKVKLTYEEQRILIMGLVELKNHLIAEDRYTDAIDELIMKLTK